MALASGQPSQTTICDRKMTFQDNLYHSRDSQQGTYSDTWVCRQEHVPIELYRTIVENITDKSSLLSLCLTNSAFKVEAERILYESMTTPLTETNMILHTRFLQTVSSVKRLAVLVRTYHFSRGEKCYFAPPKSLPWLLRSALKAMLNLRELCLDVADTAVGTDETGPVKLPFIFEECIFQLDTLHMLHCVDAKAFCAFLVTQKNLRKLTAYFNPCTTNKNFVLPPAACPSLEVLQGNRSAIDALLPNRRISSLLWDPDMYEMNQSMRHLCEPLSHLKILALEGSFLRPSLHFLAEHLKSVECVELVTLHYGELDVIDRISSLRKLILTNAFSYTTWVHRASTIHQLFSSCASLEFIAVQNILSVDRHQHNMYECWIFPNKSDNPFVAGVQHKESIYQGFNSDNLIRPSNWL